MIIMITTVKQLWAGGGRITGAGSAKASTSCAFKLKHVPRVWDAISSDERLPLCPIKAPQRGMCVLGTKAARGERASDQTPAPRRQVPPRQYSNSTDIQVHGCAAMTFGQPAESIG